jgi:hypothetical protein
MKVREFIFSESLLDIIQELDPPARLCFYEAAAIYGVDEIEPCFTGIENVLWIALRTIIDKDRENYFTFTGIK